MTKRTYKYPGGTFTVCIKEDDETTGVIGKLEEQFEEFLDFLGLENLNWFGKAIMAIALTPGVIIGSCFMVVYRLFKPLLKWLFFKKERKIKLH